MQSVTISEEQECDETQVSNDCASDPARSIALVADDEVDNCSQPVDVNTLNKFISH